MKTEDLLAKLSEDAPKVRVVTVPRIFLAGALLALAYGLVVNLALFPSRADLGARIPNLRFLALLLLPLVLAVWGWLRAATETSGAGGGRRLTAGLWGLVLGYMACAWAYSSFVSDRPFLGLDPQDFRCAALIFLLTLPIWFAASLAAYLVLPQSRLFQRAVAFAGFGFAALLVNLHCPYDGHGHHWFGHALLPAAFVLLAYPLLAKLSYLSGRRLIRWREGRQLRSLRP
jgi:hypothetical protein